MKKDGLGNSPASPPGLPGHDAVVDHVEGGQVAELLPHQEEERVRQVDDFRKEEPPGHVEGPDGLGAVGVVDRLARPAVVARHVEPGLTEGSLQE